MDIGSHQYKLVKKFVGHLKNESFFSILEWEEKRCICEEVWIFENLVIKTFKRTWNMNDFQHFCDSLGIIVETTTEKLIIDFTHISSSSDLYKRRLDLLFSQSNHSQITPLELQTQILSKFSGLRKVMKIQNFILNNFKSQSHL